MNTDEQTDSYTPAYNRLASSTISAKPSQFFTYPELTQCLDLICNLTENSKQIPLIKGIEGAGKTTLLLQLQSQTPEHWMLCRINANPMMHPDQLYALLGQYFGIAEKSRHLKQGLLNHFKSLQHDGTLPIIAVDDAHLLPVDSVAELLQLHIRATQTEQHLLHLILFAAPAIDDLLQMQESYTNSSRIIQTLDMPPLTPVQAAAYITQALLARGALEAFALTTDQIDTIIFSSHGLPGQIENYLEKLPALPTASQKSTERTALKLLTEGLPTTAIVSTFGLISILTVLLLFQDEINTLFYTPPSDESLSNNTIIRDNPKIALKSPPLPHPKTAIKPPAKLPPQVTPVEELEPVSTIEEAATTIAKTPLTHKAGSKPIIKTPTPATTVNTPMESTTATQIEPTTPAPEKSNPITTPVKPVTVNNNPIPASKTKIAVKSKSTKEKAWLLSQKPTAYTLQIIGLTDKPSVLAYIKRHRLVGKIAYFRTSHNGQSWYPLLYGIYPNRAAAVAARPKLASQLRQKGIWPRNLASVHKEIKAAK